MCGATPSGCVQSCAEQGDGGCLKCQVEAGAVGWSGMMDCGFTPCSFTDQQGFEACAASCDADSASCEFVLESDAAEACAPVCAE